MNGKRLFVALIKFVIKVGFPVLFLTFPLLAPILACIFGVAVLLIVIAIILHALAMVKRCLNWLLSPVIRLMT